MPKKKRSGRTARSVNDRGKGGAGKEEALLDLLTTLGLTLNESRAYLALLDAGEVTAAEAAARAAIPRPKVYEALANLESSGFAHSFGGRVRSYTPVDPETALSNWAEHRQEERAALAERDQASVDSLVRQLPRPSAAPTVAIPDFIEAISGRLPTAEALEGVMSDAEKHLHEMLQPPFVQPQPRWNKSEIEALKRGVEVRIIYTPDAIANPQRYLPLKEAGGEVRVIDTLPMKLLIRDDEEALVSLRDANTRVQSVTTARIRHVDLVHPLESLFQEVWHEAKPIE